MSQVTKEIPYPPERLLCYSGAIAHFVYAFHGRALLSVPFSLAGIALGSAYFYAGWKLSEYEYSLGHKLAMGTSVVSTCLMVPYAIKKMHPSPWMMGMMSPLIGALVLWESSRPRYEVLRVLNLIK
ncbi:hypothetical protein ROZALSC1DRAFT_28017 [Rozella allomycis CSF55]|uniref:Uncharacterized protein n=1 Tax=Rozella allomycis (strain CSF55) TaxID=988480 RepID=A0A075AS03_ROZAC|nr:hypothetical protein O9G_000968 [Rozella allomycis CSF55]RKP20499.1 hypothetical protein ROZALSC1DRAFT_28017 [Rozella allomycis CSF55]|eukprot:EPZ31323.1 hypothetical protein O9G_000968 [Rozella allomycis CSF55]